MGCREEFYVCECVCVCVCVYDSSWNGQMFMKWLRVHWLNFADISHLIFNLFGNTDYNDGWNK